MRMLRTGWLAVLVVGAGCSHLRPATHPLYAGPARPATEVARLSGPIATVDGVDVSSLGSSFELLPGCHVVELRRKIGEGNLNGAWSTELRYAVYAFRMKAGSSYEIDLRLQRGNGGVGNANVAGAEVEAVERDAAGKLVQTVAPVRKPSEVEACKAWEAEQTKAKAPAPSEPALSAPATNPDAGTPPAPPAATPDAGAPDSR